MSLRHTLDFLLYEWLQVQTLSTRERFAEHNRETYDAVLDTCERIAREKFAPHNRTVDTEEPQFDGERVILPAATQAAHDAYVASGMLSAAQDHDIGGMQLPFTVESAANAFFSCASVSISAHMLTVGNANLLMAHGTERQRTAFALNEFNGRFAGTMCLSEPQAGSSLSDIATRATPDGDDFEDDPLGPRYRLRGSKMWISTGDHELTENIVHLVLAKVPGPDGHLVPGTRGISLFIVPKRLVDAQGQLTGER
ncbi:MAG: acyl-CoA dehydrogenase family protein, partial [Limnohabitans sp.]